MGCMDYSLNNYRIAPNFRGSKIREIAKNHLNVNFRDKNFVIATFL